MKRYLRSAALLLIGLSTAIPVLAECPEGKSEVLLMTPSGRTKTICVSDNAIPGIENAAEHAGGFTIEPECPCLDVWDGAPYPEGTDVLNAPPVLPDDLSTAYCQADSSIDLTSVRAEILLDEGFYIYAARAITEERDECYIDTYADNIGGGYALLEAPPAIFTDGTVSPTDHYTSLMIEACKALLVDRGCAFQ